MQSHLTTEVCISQYLKYLLVLSRVMAGRYQFKKNVSLAGDREKEAGRERTPNYHYLALCVYN